MRDLNRTTHLLINMGQQRLISQLLAGPLPTTIELPFASIKTAKAVMRLLYQWMWFYPEVKARTSLRLDESINVLFIIPKGISEKRGRKGAKRG